ncbi:vasorin-like [Ptychodera flava]|uniref:vasorin-like n=1 Tax=Ptychodera flava TaxID=63121 RepID=UPI00396A1E1B
MGKLLLAARRTLPSIVVFLCWAITGVNSVCPVRCSCNTTIDAVIVDCTSQGLTNIPSPLPDNTTHLYLRDNEIDSFSGLQNYEQIIVLDLSWNKIRSIPQSRHRPELSMEILDLSYNNIRQIEAYCFTGLDNLLLLDLSGNVIDSIDGDTFIHLPSLTELRLHDNKLNIFTKSTNTLLMLETLDLSSNEIYSLHDSMLSDMDELITLSLQRNAIIFVDKNVFHSLQNLRRLDISYNPIKKLPDIIFDGMDSLEYLELSADSLDAIAEVAKTMGYTQNWFKAMINMQFVLSENSYFQDENGSFTDQKVGIRYMEKLNSISKTSSASNALLSQQQDNLFEPQRYNGIAETGP